MHDFCEVSVHSAIQKLASRANLFSLPVTLLSSKSSRRTASSAWSISSRPFCPGPVLILSCGHTWRASQTRYVRFKNTPDCGDSSFFLCRICCVSQFGGRARHLANSPRCLSLLYVLWLGLSFRVLASPNLTLLLTAISLPSMRY
jgi:hypothetical protein